jgi:hypothetical protein
MEVGFERANEESWKEWPKQCWAGRSLEAFLNELWAQETKNKTCKAKEQKEYNPQQIYDCAIFNWQSALLTSKVDEEMSMRGSVNI